MDLKVTEAVPVMEMAFRDQCVNLDVAGDWEDVQIGLGLRDHRTTPRPKFSLFPNIGRMADLFASGDMEWADDSADDSNEEIGMVSNHVRESEKIGRNKPCPCGSGKKYKKCCS